MDRRRSVDSVGCYYWQWAVIASRSHVVKNVEPYAIVGGNPAKFIKYRFSKENIEKLQNLKWWCWDINKINENIHILYSKNIESLVNK